MKSEAAAQVARPRASAEAGGRNLKAWNGAVADRDERHRIKRLAILNAAAVLFVDGGYAETTLDDIASALHVTKPTLYYYVRSKEDILVAILGEALGAAEEQFAAARALPLPGIDRLHAFVRDWVADMTHPYGRCLLTMRSTPLAAAPRARLAEAFRRLDGFVRALLAAGIADGSIRACDERMAAFVVFGAINTVPFWYSAAGAMSSTEAADGLFTVLRDGLAAKGRMA